MDLKAKVAIVTGGASGLGRATAEEFVGAGAKVVIFDMQEDLAKEVAASLGPNAAYVLVDVTDEASVVAGVKKTVATFGAVHICVNCAGITMAAKTVSKGEPFPLATFAKVVNVNLIGTFNVLRIAALEMEKNEGFGVSKERGVIVNTGSGAAFDGQMGQAAYSASKAGVIGMTLPIARDLAGIGIRVVTIAPGLFETPMVTKALPPNVRESLQSTSLYPKRMGDPKEYALLVRHIVENSYLNAECIRLDAGTRMSAR